MRRTPPAVSLALVALPLTAVRGQQLPAARFETVAHTTPALAPAEAPLLAVRAQAMDSAARYSRSASRQRLLQRTLYVGGAALVAGSYAHWLGGDTRRGMTAGGAALLGAGLGSAAYGIDRRDAAERARAASARWKLVAAGEAR